MPEGWSYRLQTRPHLRAATARRIGGGKSGPPLWEIKMNAAALGARSSLSLREEGLGGAMREMFGLADVRVGDVEFNRRFKIRGGSPEALRELLLRPEARSLVERLFSRAIAVDVMPDGRVLIRATRHRTDSLEKAKSLLLLAVRHDRRARGARPAVGRGAPAAGALTALPARDLALLLPLLAALRVERAEVLGGELQPRGRGVLLEVLHLPRAGNRAASPGCAAAPTRARPATASPPAASRWCRATPPGLARRPAGEREPGDEADALLLAVVEHVLALPVHQVVEVLHGRDREVLLRGLDLLDRHLGQADVADQALVLHLGDRGELLVARAPSGRCGAAARGRAGRPSAGAGSSARTAAGTRAGRPASRRSGRAG